MASVEPQLGKRASALWSFSSASCSLVWWPRSEERAQTSRVMFDAETALRRLLDNMQPLRLGSQGSRAIEFRGIADELDGIVPLPPNIGLGGLYRLHLFRNRSARRLDLTFRAYEQGVTTGDDAAALTT